MLPRFFAAADLNGHLRRGLSSDSYLPSASPAWQHQFQLLVDATGVQPLHQFGHQHLEYLADAEEGA